MTEIAEEVEKLDIGGGPALRSIINITYCGICSLPPEYCEYGTSLNKCKNWLESNDSHLYEILYKGLSPEQVQEIEAKPDKEKAPKKEKTTAKKRVLITIVERTKRKRVTHIEGLDYFSKSWASS
jgi:hypothetical protein